MAFYKNKNTDEIANFGGIPDLDEWECIEENGEIKGDFEELYQAQSLEKLKNKKDIELRNDAEKTVFDKYPIYTQFNIMNQILGYSQNDLDEMKAFIESEVLKYREKKDILDALEDEESIEDLSF